MADHPQMILLDTCALLWWTLEPRKLSSKAADACSGIRTTGAFVSSISLWEIGAKHKIGTMDLGMSLKNYLARLKSMNSLTFLPVDEETWLLSLSLRWKHEDPVDRVIVASARKHRVPLVTKDKEMRAFYRRCIW